MTERDLVSRLRWPSGLPSPEDHPVSVALRGEAATEIERLRDRAASDRASLVAYAQSLEKQISDLHRIVGEMESARRVNT